MKNIEGQCKNILLVDDERLILSSLARRLRGHRVFKAGNIAEAKDLLKREAMDLMVTDYHMPDGDGIVLLQIARREYPMVRRALMSADPPLNLGELIHAGVVEGFFLKPFGSLVVAKILNMVQDLPVQANLAVGGAAVPVEHNASVQ